MLLVTFINYRTMTTLSCFYRWLNCLMPDTSSYVISCRSFLRVWGVTISFAACFKDDEFLKHIHRILQVCQDLWCTCACFLSDFERTGIKKHFMHPEVLSAERIARMLGTYRNGQTPTSYALCGKSLSNALTDFIKMAFPFLLKNFCCDNTPKCHNLVFSLYKVI